MDFHKEDEDVDHISRRSSCAQMLLKIDVLKKFAIFTGRRLCWSLSLIMLLDLQLYSKETPRQLLSQTCVHTMKILSTPFFYTTLLVVSFLLFYCFSKRKLWPSNFLILTFSFGRNVTLTFSRRYFSIYCFYSYFLTITRL